MNDFFEIDFLDVQAEKSGDAITIRYQKNGEASIHVVDGGFQGTGETVVEHIRKCYDNPVFIDRVVVTHNDGDHAGGLRSVLEEFDIRELWMARPWLYAEEIIGRFEGLNSVDHFKARLRSLYPNISILEELADKKGIPIFEPFQSARIGEFTVLAPSKERYLDLIVASDRTPVSLQVNQNAAFSAIGSAFGTAVAKVTNLVKAVWGVEVFSQEETSAENEMSVVQYSDLCGKKILLTGDTGRSGLTEAADFAPAAGLSLPGVDLFQVPHHGSRRNVNTEVLDRWLGERKSDQFSCDGRFSAIVSAAKGDTNHPRKAVIRALIHRGADVFTTEGHTFCKRHNSPVRQGWIAACRKEYPNEQEE